MNPQNIRTGTSARRRSTAGTLVVLVLAVAGLLLGVAAPAFADEPVTISGDPTLATYDEPYSFAFTVAGTPAPVVKLADGRLPEGLDLSPDGVLSGKAVDLGDFTFTLVADNGVSQATTTATLTVLDPSAPLPYLKLIGSSVTEGNDHAHPMTFTLALSSPVSYAVTVDWATADGTATAGSDYNRASGTVTFAPGEQIQTISVKIRADLVKEHDESLYVRLGNPQGATVPEPEAIGWILNDD